MTAPVDPAAIAAAARQLLEQRNALRIATVETLARVQADRDRLRDELTCADSAVADAHAAALKGGWTPDELAQIGLQADKPRRAGGRRSSGRPRGSPASPRARVGAQNALAAGPLAEPASAEQDGHGEA